MKIAVDKKYYSTIIIITIIVIVSIVGFGKGCYIQKKGIYTVAIVKDIEGTRGGVLCNFYYSYKGVAYEGRGISASIRKKDEGKRFYIQFLQGNPSVKSLLENCPVPDCIGDPPPEGWKEIPKCKEIK